MSSPDPKTEKEKSFLESFKKSYPLISDLADKGDPQAMGFRDSVRRSHTHP